MQPKKRSRACNVCVRACEYYKDVCRWYYPPSTLHQIRCNQKPPHARIPCAHERQRYCDILCRMLLLKLLTPPPTPPLQGRGAAAALPAAWDSVGTPLPCRGGVGGGVTNFSKKHSAQNVAVSLPLMRARDTRVMAFLVAPDLVEGGRWKVEGG